MQYREYVPAAPLQPYVRCYWTLRGKQAQSTTDRVFPDGCTELIFHRGDSFAVVGEGGDRLQQPKALYFGQLERFILLRPARSVETLGVRFQPAGAAPLLGVPARETATRMVGFEDLAGRGGRELEGRVQDAGSLAAALRHVEVYLLRRVDDGRAADAAVAAAVATIEQAAGSISVGALARSAGLGIRQFERRFALGVGLSPKRLATVTRLQSAFALIESGGSRALTDVAHDCGYFDQSHFIRDFRRFAGLSPGQFLHEDRGVGHLFVAR